MLAGSNLCTKNHVLHVTYKNALCRIVDLTRFASTGPSIDGLMRALALQTLKPFGVNSCSVLLRGSGEHLEIQGEFGLNDNQAKELVDLRLDSTHPIALAMQTTKQIYTDEVEGLETILGSEEAILLLPMVQNGEVFGLFVLILQKQGKLDDVDEMFFSIISNILTQSSLDQVGNTSKSAGVPDISSEASHLCATEELNQATESLLSELNLTRRQHEIAVMIANGVTNREIARKMAYSEATIRYETIKLYERLRVRNRSHAAARIRELKIA